MTAQTLRISSPDFPASGPLDGRHSKGGGNVPPLLLLSGVPEGTVELAVMCHDPDAPKPRGFTHWTLYGLAPGTREVGADADSRFRAGPNDAGDRGYVGPYPPVGHGIHHYYFWAYALDTHVEGEPDREQFLDRYGANILQQDRVVGTFES